MNILWAAMLLIGILYGACTGNLTAVTDAAIASAKDAVELCIVMAGVMGLWVGLMEIAKKAGIIDGMTRKMMPVLHKLFPEVPPEHPAMSYISANIIANILGLSWACTPPGLKAMEELSSLNGHSKTASNAMCTFLVVNISSLQLIPVNVIAYRSQYGSVNPTRIVGPAVAATLVSTLTGLLYCRIITRVRKNRAGDG